MSHPSRHERLKSLFASLSVLPDEERRTALGRIRDEDPDIAAELHSLLVQATRPEFKEHGLASALAEAVETLETEATPAPRQLGPYRLLEQLGSGGMGVVFRAEQTQPIRREVAVKILRGGLSRETLMARFEAERRAMALIDHPGVARILDAGDESGTSYLVMEMVRGVPITDYVRDRALDTRASLPLFIAACRVVQHAHQKGVIHRDLKPGNILVTEIDGRAVSKVIDFGIARIADDGEAGMTLTGAGQVLGTLEYMSPEQASGRSRDVDTRSDVYSLGAVLYELLTGTVPHDLRDKSYSEAIETIRKDSPRPFRQTRIAERHLDADLETITKKALELDPARRYDGPGALADDLERYLRTQPILARPPSAAYQVRKLVQRHRAAVATGAAVFVLLIAFGVSMSVLYARQIRERERAEREAEKAEAANRFLREMIGAATPNRLGKDVTIRRAMDQALESLSRGYGTNPEVLAVVQHALGTAYLELGEPARADSLLRRALALQVKAHGESDPASTEMLLALAATAANRGSSVQAESLAERAIRLVPPGSPHADARLADAYQIRGEVRTLASPAQGDSLLDLAVHYARRAHGPESAELAHVQALLGSARAMKGDVSGGLALLRPASQTLERTLGPAHSRTINALTLLSQFTPYDEAIRIKQRLLDTCLASFGPDHPLTGEVENDLAISYMLKQNYAEAEKLERAAIESWIRAYGPVHGNLAAGYNNLAYIDHCQGELEEAAQGFERAVQIITETEGPDNASIQVYRKNLACVRLDQGRADEALRMLRDVHDAYLRGTGAAVEGRYAAEEMGSMAMAHWMRGDADSAIAWSRRSLASYERMKLENDPSVSVVRCVLAMALYEAGLRDDADSILRTEARRVVEGDAWPTDKRRVLVGLERHYKNRGRLTDAAYFLAAREAMPR